MKQSIAESCDVLSQFLEARKDPLKPLPANQRIRSAIEYLADRLREHDLKTEALADLGQSPVRLTDRVDEIAARLLSLTLRSPTLVKEMVRPAPNSKIAAEKLINKSFAVILILLVLYLAEHIEVARLSGLGLAWFACWVCLPLLISARILLFPWKPEGILTRLLSDAFAMRRQVALLVTIFCFLMLLRSASP